MSGRFKTFFRVSLFSSLVWCILSMSPSHSGAYKIARQVLDGGGANWLSTTNYQLCSSLGQPIIGDQDNWSTGDNYSVGSGFWNEWVVGMTPVEEEGEDSDLLPKQFALHQNYPNPFNLGTIIKYALPKASEVKIHIYNILGQKVRSLVNERQEAGYRMIRWDGNNDRGNEVSSGVYFYRIEAGDFVKSKKMILLK